MKLPKYLLFAVLGCAASAGAKAQDFYSSDNQLAYTIVDASTMTVNVSANAATLDAVTIPATASHSDAVYTVVGIADNGFANNGLSSITIEAANLSIGNSAFSGCAGLKSVTVANDGSITKLGVAAFNGCSALTDVALSEGLDSISESAFYGCEALTELSLPESVVKIGESAFAGCSSLDSVDIDDNVTQLCSSAFADCVALTSVSLPNKITSIGDFAFQGCIKLASVTLPSALDSIGEYSFDSSILESVTLPVTLKYIGSNAFRDCKYLTSISFPKSVVELGNYCFEGCDALETVVFEDGSDLKSLGTIFAGKGCGVKNIILGDGITTIAEDAFASLSKLESVTLPKTVTQLNDNVFNGCDSLKIIKSYAVTPPSLNTGTFTGIQQNNGVSRTVTVYVPNASLSAYESTSADGWAWVTSPTLVFKGLYGFNVQATTDSDAPTIVIETPQDFLDAFSALSDENNGYSNANVVFANELTFDETYLDLDVLSAANIYTVLDKLPTVASTFNGTMSGARINNMSVRSAGIFNTIGEGATIDGLELNNATIYADLTNTSVYKQEGDEIGIPLLAQKIDGTVNNFSFTGSIIVDEDLAKGKNLTLYIADEASDNATINGFVYLDEAFAMGTNKRCITIKQNLGVRNSPTAKIKMARQKLRKDGGNKSLDGDEYQYSEDELIKNVREFDDDEFASGVVAYWLNFEEAGYTGKYTARWSQGKTVPIAATIKNGVTNALYAVDYGATDMAHIISGKRFANNGSQITITYDQKPENITVGDTKLITYGDNSVTLTFDHTKAINFNFGSETPTADVETPAAKVEVSSNGCVVTVAGAEGEPKTLYNMMGATVASTTGSELVAPAAGIYVVRTGDISVKVVLK